MKSPEEGAIVVDFEKYKLQAGKDAIMDQLDPLVYFIEGVLDMEAVPYKEYLEISSGEDNPKHLFVVYDDSDLQKHEDQTSYSWQPLRLFIDKKKVFSVNAHYSRKLGANIINCSSLVGKRMTMRNTLDITEVERCLLNYLKTQVLELEETE